MDSPLVKNFEISTQERIICAAVIHCGVIFQGKRHNDAISLAVKIIGNPPVKGRGNQGFWTNWNRYVDRKKAMEIAVEAGQVEKPSNPDAVLISEDLY